MPATAEDTPLLPLCRSWASLIKKARDHRQECFGNTADLCHRFYTESHDFVYADKNRPNGFGADVPSPSFKCTVNKVAELVQLFGPSLYHKNPSRYVKDRKVTLPDSLYHLRYGMYAPSMLQQRDLEAEIAKITAEVLSIPLNYTPQEFDLKRESSSAIDEALIAGRGFLMHEMAAPPGGGLPLPKHYYVSWKRVYIDPDAESIHDATWIAVEFQGPSWEVEKEFLLPEGALKDVAKAESANRQGQIDGDSRGGWSRKQGVTHDLVTYYKVFSKAGMGHRISAPSTDPAASFDTEKFRGVLEQFGDHCFLVICDGISYPLNVPPDVQNAPIDAEVEDPVEAAAAAANLDDLKRRLRWPVPFHKDGGWPVSELDLHPVPGDLWPMAHLRPALGELMFLDWVMSWLAGRVQFTGRTLIALAGHIDEEYERLIRDGSDLEVIKLSAMHRDLKEAIQILQFPEVNADVWKIIDIVSEMFDKRTGLTELVYGLSGKQMRSASEAQLKEERTSIRPDDMADKVEEWQSVVARKEALMLRWNCPPQAVAPIFREQFDPTGMQAGPATLWWAEHVYVPPDDETPGAEDKAVREFDYTIQAGSVRKPNLEKAQADADLAAQTFLPLYQQHYFATGDPTPLNGFTAVWAQAHMMDPGPLMFPPLMMQPPPAPVGPDGQPVQEPQPAGVM